MLKITTSHKNSAWKSAYFYWDDKKLGYIGVDPYNSNGMIGPRLFGGMGYKVFYFNLPYLKWKANAGEIRNKIYQVQNNLWHKVDTRY